MKITSSYAVEIKGIDKHFKTVAKIWKKAVSYCIEKVEYHWYGELEYMGTLERCTFMDSILHNTSRHHALYDFDTRFPKMPSYFRRAVINTAIGHVSSYHSNLINWEATDKSTNPPTLSVNINKLPVFYNKNMYSDADELPPYTVKLKLFIDNDWKWIAVKIKPTDSKYIVRHCNMGTISSPTLERRNKKWFLRFAFEDDVKLRDTDLSDRKILAVDLGINTDATCSVMKSDGTILSRKFINFVSDKDQLYHTLNKIKKVSQKYSGHNVSKLWRLARFRNENLSKKVSKAITEYAIQNNCDVIVFEYLDFTGKLYGSQKQKVSMWRKRDVQHRVENKAHKAGIRVNRVCAKNTSKLACDGSGEVKRGKEAGFNTYSLCKFATGKAYNCDLSASYNIGARYFIREILKTIPAREWSQLRAKVPQIGNRSQCTLSTLLGIV